MKILILDNYDSFTFNLVHLAEQFDGFELGIFRNDEITLREIEKYDGIILSPGPGLPSEAGIMPEVIKKYSSSKAILGVCLGHQAIAEVFEAKLFNMEQVLHGKSTLMQVTDKEETLFKNIPEFFFAGRYHSWMVDHSGLPSCFAVTAIDEKKRIMALRHRTFNIRSVQFHPESILTEYGKELMGNWLSTVKETLKI